MVPLMTSTVSNYEMSLNCVKRKTLTLERHSERSWATQNCFGTVNGEMNDHYSGNFISRVPSGQLVQHFGTRSAHSSTGGTSCEYNNIGLDNRKLITDS